METPHRAVAVVLVGVAVEVHFTDNPPAEVPELVTNLPRGRNLTGRAAYKVLQRCTHGDTRVVIGWEVLAIKSRQEIRNDNAGVFAVIQLPGLDQLT
jgi:hypothetical protein